MRMLRLLIPRLLLARRDEFGTVFGTVWRIPRRCAQRGILVCDVLDVIS